MIPAHEGNKGGKGGFVVVAEVAEAGGLDVVGLQERGPNSFGSLAIASEALVMALLRATMRRAGVASGTRRMVWS